jgi:hypothetical protein
VSMDILSWVIPIPLLNLFVPVPTGGFDKTPYLVIFPSFFLHFSFCHPKMVMSYLAKIEMSAFGGSIMLYYEGGHYGRRGHYHGAAKGIKTATRH